jgi:Head domain of trimeric autotransporter adhesin
MGLQKSIIIYRIKLVINMKKIFIFYIQLTNICAFGQSSVLIEPNGSNGILSKNATIVFSAPTSVTLPVSGAGTRLMWIPAKSAFRVGTVSGTQWDDSNIGTWSFSSGSNTTASGLRSTSLGAGTIASGFVSTSMGNGTNASGENSVSMGVGTIAIGGSSTSMGGFTTASGNNSTSMGNNTTAQARSSVAMGYYNVIAGSTNTDEATDPLLVVGNGTSLTRSNALTLLKNSNLGLNTATPQYQLSFKDDLGDKISFYYGNTSNTTNHYGIGIQAAKFQLFTPSDDDDLVFGYGRSAAFTENVRFKGKGQVGIGVNNPSEFLDVNGRMRVRHRPGNTAGVWMSNDVNSTAVGDGAFYGLKSNTEAGIFIGGAWRFGVTNSGVVSASGGISVGGGETIAKIRKTSVTYNIPSIPANSSILDTFTISDLSSTDNIIVNPDGTIFPLIIAYTRYLASTAMEIVFYNPTNVTVDKPSISFNVTVIK